jgi:hypothetical protein
MRRTLVGLVAGLVAAAALVAQASPAMAAKARPRPVGYDISFPQCGKTYPSSPAFGIVGVGGGRAFDHNPCLASEYTWATGAPKAPAFYMNTGNPGTLSARWTLPGPRACSGAATDAGCAYNYGWNNATDAMGYAEQQTPAGAAPTKAWWLDVETANSWSTNQSLNVTTLQGSVDYLRSRGVPLVGMYSTAGMWGQITGGARMSVPSWVAGASSQSQAKSYCGAGFTGGGVRLVQFPSAGFDGDIVC